MPSLSKEFRQLCNDVPKDSKLLFGDDINQCIMSISKTLKSVVKYQSSSRHDDKYSRPSKSYNYYQNQPKNFKSFPKTSSSPFGKKNKRNIIKKYYNIIILSKEILRVRLSNLDMKDLSLKIDRLKAGNIKRRV